MGVENPAPTRISSLDRPAHKHFKHLASGGSHQFLTARVHSSLKHFILIAFKSF